MQGLESSYVNYMWYGRSFYCLNFSLGAQCCYTSRTSGALRRIPLCRSRVCELVCFICLDEQTMHRRFCCRRFCYWWSLVIVISRYTVGPDPKELVLEGGYRTKSSSMPTV